MYSNCQVAGALSWKQWPPVEIDEATLSRGGRLAAGNLLIGRRERQNYVRMHSHRLGRYPGHNNEVAGRVRA